jgi:hypothetical protein
MPNPIPTTRAFSLLCLLSALTFAGCGGGDTADQDDGATAVASAAESDGPPGLVYSFDTKNPNAGLVDATSSAVPADQRATAARVAQRPKPVATSGTSVTAAAPAATMAGPACWPPPTPAAPTARCAPSPPRKVWHAHGSRR